MFVPADGEEFHLHLVLGDANWQSDSWQRRMLPHTDEVASTTSLPGESSPRRAMVGRPTRGCWRRKQDDRRFLHWFAGTVPSAGTATRMGAGAHETPRGAGSVPSATRYAQTATAAATAHPHAREYPRLVARLTKRDACSPSPRMPCGNRAGCKRRCRLSHDEP